MFSSDNIPQSQAMMTIIFSIIHVDCQGGLSSTFSKVMQLVGERAGNQIEVRMTPELLMKENSAFVYPFRSYVDKARLFFSLVSEQSGQKYNC